MMIQRPIQFPERNSFFLFGPRGSGKTTLLQERFPSERAIWIDLLDIAVYDQLLLEPQRFSAMIDAPGKTLWPVVIDEVQKLPRLLDLVHSQIQKHKRQFVLTGSSSRRLKQQGTNLLAGRAWIYHLYPFSSPELGHEATSFPLQRVLELGTLPDAYLATRPEEAIEFLNAYAGTYLEKEIQQEQWVRNLAPFRKFLAIAAQMNGKILNKSNIASDIGTHDVTVAHYFEILEDTLLGFMVPAFHTSIRKAQKQAPKFYFIDPGIKRALDRTLTVPLLPQTSAFGEAFEHWIILEFIKRSSYQRLNWRFSYLRTKDDVEIDLIIERPGKARLLIEIKSTARVSPRDASSLERLGNDLDEKATRYLLSNDPLSQNFGKTRARHWLTGLNEIFQ